MKKILNFLKFSKRNTAKIIFSGISYYFLINYNHEKTIFNIETKIQPEINEIKPLEKNIFEISGKINPLIKSLIERLEKINIKIIEKNDEKQEFYGINSDNEKKEFKINDERDFIKVLNFYNSIEIIENEEKFFEKIESLKDNEKIIIGFMKNEDKKAFKEIKYDFIDNNSMFYLINECNLMNKFNFELNSIICIKKNEECFNYLHNDKKFQLEKFELNEKISKNLYKKCLESINYVNIDQEIINLLNICNELKMNKFLICSFLKNSDDLTKEKYKKKLKKISDENKDILFILTENQTILKNYFRIIPDKYENTIRYIDYSNKMQNEEIKSYTLIHHQISDNNLISSSNFHEKLIPDSFKSDKKFYRVKYSGNISKKLLRLFLNKSKLLENHNYYENDIYISPIYYSENITGNQFNKKVLESNQDIILLFYKPGCISCKTVSISFENFAKTINDIQIYLKNVSDNKTDHKKYENNIINKYKILNQEKFKNLSIFRYNIFNECEFFASPSNVPVIMILSKTKKLTIIDLQKERINIKNSDDVIKALIRKIDDIL